METTNIEWTDSTFNPWIGCTKVSPGCDNCYAERDFDKRRHVVKWGAGNPRKRTSEANWKNPIKWNKYEFFQCENCGLRSDGLPYQDFSASGGVIEDGHKCPSCLSRSMEPVYRTVFCASLADVFDNEVPGEWRRDLFALIRATTNLHWLILTKRIGNVEAMAAECGGWPKNAALGFTAVNQTELERDWEKAQACKRDLKPLYLFISIEPMLGPMRLDQVARRPRQSMSRDQPEDRGNDWTYYDNALSGFNAHKCGGSNNEKLDWVIVGGESGPNARPMHPGWVRSLRDQCAAAQVPFLFKQWGDWAPYDRGRTDSSTLATPQSLDMPMQRFGKKAAGRLLDGVQYDGYPENAS